MSFIGALLPKHWLRSPLKSPSQSPPQSQSFPMKEAIAHLGPPIIKGVVEGTIRQQQGKSRPDDIALCQGTKNDPLEKKKNPNHCCNDMGYIWCGGSSKQKRIKKIKLKTTKGKTNKRKTNKGKTNKGKTNKGKTNKEKTNKEKTNKEKTIKN